MAWATPSPSEWSSTLLISSPSSDSSSSWSTSSSSGTPVAVVPSESRLRARKERSSWVQKRRCSYAAWASCLIHNYVIDRLSMSSQYALDWKSVVGFFSHNEMVMKGQFGSWPAQSLVSFSDSSSVEATCKWSWLGRIPQQAQVMASTEVEGWCQNVEQFRKVISDIPFTYRSLYSEQPFPQWRFYTDKCKKGRNTFMSYMSLHVVLRSSCFTFRSISLFHCNLLSDMNIMNHEHHSMSAPLNHPRSLSSVTVPVPVPFPWRVRDLKILQLQRKRQLATTKRCGDVVVSFDWFQPVAFSLTWTSLSNGCWSSLDSPNSRSRHLCCIIGVSLLCGSHLQKVLIGKDPAAGSGDGVDRGGGGWCQNVEQFLKVISLLRPFTVLFSISPTFGRKGTQMKSLYHWFDTDIKGCKIH